MKKIIVIALVMAGCNSHNQHEFDRYYDSSMLYYAKWGCYWECQKYDSAEMMRKIQFPFSDSVDKYYDLMYPDKKEVPAVKPPEETNCNCR